MESANPFSGGPTFNRVDPPETLRIGLSSSWPSSGKEQQAALRFTFIQKGQFQNVYYDLSKSPTLLEERFVSALTPCKYAFEKKDYNIHDLIERFIDSKDESIDEVLSQLASSVDAEGQLLRGVEGRFFAAAIRLIVEGRSPANVLGWDALSLIPVRTRFNFLMDLLSRCSDARQVPNEHLYFNLVYKEMKRILFQQPITDEERAIIFYGLDETVRSLPGFDPKIKAYFVEFVDKTFLNILLGSDLEPSRRLVFLETYLDKNSMRDELIVIIEQIVNIKLENDPVNEVCNDLKGMLCAIQVRKRLSANLV